MFPVPSILSALEIFIDAQLMLVAVVKGADPVAVICCTARPSKKPPLPEPCAVIPASCSRLKGSWSQMLSECRRDKQNYGVLTSSVLIVKKTKNSHEVLFFLSFEFCAGAGVRVSPIYHDNYSQLNLP